MGGSTRSSRRLLGHATLAVAELLAVLASLLATAAVLVAGAFALAAVRALGALVTTASDALRAATGVAVPSVAAWNAAVHAGVVLATFLALASFGALAVAGYRHAFEAFDEVHPGTAAVVPLVGVALTVLPVATGAVALSPWPFASAALWAHALAYRLVAIDALDGGSERTAVLAGAVVAVPAVVSQALFLSGQAGVPGALLATDRAGASELARAALDAATAAGLPLDRSLLLVVPAGVALVYAARRLPDPRGRLAGDRFDGPPVRFAPGTTGSTPAPESTASRSSFVPPTTSSTGSNSGSAAAAADDVVRAPTGWVPSSPSDVNEGSRRADDDGDATGGRASGSGSSAGSASREGGASPETGPAEGGSATDDGPDSTADPAGRDRDSGGTDTKLYEHPSTAERAGDTRIYAPGAGGAGEPGGSATAAHCPECGGDVPTGGDVRFCPGCGVELRAHPEW